MKIFVGGCNGSGKTTILNNGSIHNLEVIHATKGFMKWLDIENDYDRLRKMPDQERERKLVDFMDKLVVARNDFVLDSHYLILVHGNLKQVTANWISKFDGYVLVKAPADLLLSRIEADSSRDRALFQEGVTHEQKIDILNRYQNAVQEEFFTLADRYNKPHLVINNCTSIDEATLQLKSFLKKLP